MKKHFLRNWYYYLGGLIILAIILFEEQGKGDFNIFISASKDLLQQRNIYEIKYNLYYHYYYDVFFALLLVPFTWLPLYVTKVIWLLLNVFFVYRIWKLIKGYLPVTLLNKTGKILFSVLSFAFILRFLRDNFHLAQLTIFMLYLSLEGLCLIHKNKKIAGSSLIALGISIKLLPIVFIPYLLYRREWKSSLYITGFIVILLFLPAIFIGYDYNNFLLAERWHLINPLNQEHILDTSERSFHSLTTLLTTLLVRDYGDYHALPLKRNIADISIQQLNIIINIVRGIFILFTLYFLRSMPFTKISSKIRQLYEISYICILAPLIFPHQQHYAFFFIFPASAYLLFYLFYVFLNKDHPAGMKHFKLKKISLIVVLCVTYLLTNSHFIIGQFQNYYDHFKTMTYGVLILMICLAFCRPDKLIQAEQS